MHQASLLLRAVSPRTATLRAKSWRCFSFWLSGLAVLVSGPGDGYADEPRTQHPLVPAIEMARRSQQVLAQIDDYEATLIKRERVAEEFHEQRIALRLRRAPLSVYMKFEDPHAGREILYVQDRNENQMLAHEGSGLSSLAGTVSLPLDSPRVQSENRHPLTDIGLHRLMDMLVQQWEYESKYAEISVQFFPNARMSNAECEVIEVSHPQPRNQFRFHVTRLYIEKSTRLPVRIENYGFPRAAGEVAPLLEEYTYLKINANVGMTDADFDPRNPRYEF